MTFRRTIRAVGLGAAALLTTLLIAQPAAAAPTGRGCAEPAAGQAFERAAATEVGVDPAEVTDAVDFGTRAGSFVVQIYRHGCLIGDHTPTGNLPMPLFSATKGITAVAVGRAITLGHFGIDDPLGRFFPQADPAHAALTVRQVLTQTTGLHFSWPADIAGLYTDQVLQSLAAPIDYEPGTTFQYAQNVLALLPKIIEITTGSDFQDFVQRELMAPLGIDRDNWVWLRDRSGNSAVNGGLAMRADDLGRIGQLLLRDGRWQDRQLVDADYLGQARQPTAANGGYGFLMWLNAGDTYRDVSPIPAHIEHPVLPGSPRDAYALAGALGQFITVVPSRDMVIVRLGIPARLDPSNLQALLSGTANPDNKELFRRATSAVSDMPDEPYANPYDDRGRPLVRNLDDLARLTDPINAASILLGVGPYASTNCNVLWCNGKPVPVDVFRLVLDVGNQIAAAAVAATADPPR